MSKRIFQQMKSDPKHLSLFWWIFTVNFGTIHLSFCLENVEKEIVIAFVQEISISLERK